MVASNRVGKEVFEKTDITFYGGSFISGQRGEVLQQVRARPRRARCARPRGGMDVLRLQTDRWPLWHPPPCHPLHSLQLADPF